jgi:hypothetical protein
MGTPYGSSCEAVNDCSTPIAFSGNTGSTPGASKTFQPQRCGLISITVIETLVVVGKPYDSSEHPAASVLLDEILGSNDCAGLNGAERWPLEVALIHKTPAGLSPRLIPSSPQSLNFFSKVPYKLSLRHNRFESSARATKLFRRPDARQRSRLFASWDQSLRHSPNSNRLCSDCHRRFPNISSCIERRRF